MKKRWILMFVLGFLLIPHGTYAKENDYYTNHNGVEIEQKLYHELCNIYSVGYVEFLTNEEFVNLTENDLYLYSEKEIVDKIKNCPDEKIRKLFEIFSNSTKVCISDIEIKDKYCTQRNIKKKM